MQELGRWLFGHFSPAGVKLSHDQVEVETHKMLAVCFMTNDSCALATDNA